jgi:hypothetical protein
MKLQTFLFLQSQKKDLAVITNNNILKYN